jgi:hypothetical protein
MRPALLILSIAVGAACADAGASIAIEDARAIRLPDGRVAVDIDVAAKERQGGNVGTYCAAATFTGQARVVEQCYADLEDGDRKTLRLVSDDGSIAPGASIVIGVRVDQLGVGRTLVAPPP